MWFPPPSLQPSRGCLYSRFPQPHLFNLQAPHFLPLVDLCNEAVQSSWNSLSRLPSSQSFSRKTCPTLELSEPMTSPEGLLSILGHRPGRSFSFRSCSSVRQQFSAGAWKPLQRTFMSASIEGKKAISDRLRGSNTASVYSWIPVEKSWRTGWMQSLVFRHSGFAGDGKELLKHFSSNSNQSMIKKQIKPPL